MAATMVATITAKMVNTNNNKNDDYNYMDFTNYENNGDSGIPK